MSDEQWESIRQGDFGWSLAVNKIMALWTPSILPEGHADRFAEVLRLIDKYEAAREIQTHELPNNSATFTPSGSFSRMLWKILCVLGLCLMSLALLYFAFLLYDAVFSKGLLQRNLFGKNRDLVLFSFFGVALLGMALLFAGNAASRTPLMKATRRGANEMVEQLLNRDCLDINECTLRGESALLEAVVHDHANIAFLLLDHGADPTFTKSSLPRWAGGFGTTQTPLEAAAGMGRTRILAAMLEKRPELIASFGQQPLKQALSSHTEKPSGNPLAYGDRLEIIQLLLEKGVNPEFSFHSFIGDKIRRVTPLMLASCKGSLRIARVLIQHGASVQATDDVGRKAADFTTEAELKRLLADRAPEKP